MNLYNDVINNPDGTYKKIYSCTEVLKSIKSIKDARETECHVFITKKETLDSLEKKERDEWINEEIEQLKNKISGKTKEDIFKDVEQKQKEIEGMELQREELENKLKDLEEQESSYRKGWAKKSGEIKNKEAEEYNKIDEIQRLEGKNAKLKGNYKYTTNSIALIDINISKLKAKENEVAKGYKDIKAWYKEATDAYDKSEREYNNAISANITAHEPNNNNPCWNSGSPHFIQICITNAKNKVTEKERKKKANYIIKEEKSQKKEKFDKLWEKHNDAKKELLEEKARFEEEYKKLQEKITVCRAELDKITVEIDKLKQEYEEFKKNCLNIENEIKEIRSKKWKISEKEEEIKKDINKLEEVEELIDRLTVLEKKKGAKLLVIKYRESVEKAEADRIAKEAADRAEVERLKLEQEVADKAEAEKLEREAKIKAEELAEKLIAEAKDIIANAGHEREIVNPKLVQLLKDKKLEDLELYLKSSKDIRVSEKVILEQFKEFNGKYSLNEGSKILSQFNAVKEEIITESKEQLSFISKIKQGIDIINIYNTEEAKSDTWIDSHSVEVNDRVMQTEITEHHQEL